MKLAYVVSGIRAAYIYDPRIKQAINNLDDGEELTLSAYPSAYVIYALKTPKGLKCSLKKDFIAPSSAANITFKSFEALLPVINNTASFTQAFCQDRYSIQGNVGLGLIVVNILDMAQAILTTKRKRQKYLKEKPYSKKVEFRIKMTAWIKGWH